VVGNGWEIELRQHWGSEASQDICTTSLCWSARATKLLEAKPASFLCDRHAVRYRLGRSAGARASCVQLLQLY
jgi:hypothetical protein